MFWLGFVEVLRLMDKGDGLSPLGFQPDPLGASPSSGEDIPSSTNELNEGKRLRERE